MRDRIKVALAAPVIGLIGWMTWQTALVREPVYRGKTLTAWLDEARSSQWFNPESDAAILAIGGQGVPTLLDMALTRKSALLERLKVVLEKLGWPDVHIRKTEEYWAEAEYGFELLGPAAKPVVPQLARLLQHDDAKTRVVAAHLLGVIGAGAKDATPALARYLDLASKERTGWNVEGMFCAISALGEIGPGASAAAPRVAALTNDPTWFIRSGARAALIEMGAESVNQLLPALENTSDSTNWLLAGVVVQFLGTNGQAVVPALIKALQETNSEVVNRAVQLLGRIQYQPERCIPAITPLLASTNTSTRIDAIEAIRGFGRNSNAESIPELVGCLKDPDPSVQSAARKALLGYPMNAPAVWHQ